MRVRVFGIVQILALLGWCALGPAAAGTTGGLRGRVLDSVSKAPLAGATVTAVSPSESVNAKTDANGSFNFISLAPDTYTVSVQLQGYQSIAGSGITVQADQVQNLGAFALIRELKTIGGSRARSTGDLVKPGTTSDVYSVNAAGQAAMQAVGGPGSINQAYSAIATTPGANVPQGQQGWNQLVYIRGGDYSDVANELDGIPVQRASDFAPITTLSTLGQQEVQTYTGGTPASAEADGLSGYINQVVKTGTYPGYENLELGIGGPTFYHKAQFEISGATPNRNITYYLGFSGVNQDYRYSDQFNGAGNSLFFAPLSIPTNNGSVYDGSGPAVFAPGQSYAIANTQDRESIANFHFAIPHKNGLKDDVQLLYLTSEVWAQYYSSINDLGGPDYVSNGLGFVPTYVDQDVYYGKLFQSPNPAFLGQAFQPSSPAHPFLGVLPNDTRDENDNGVSIMKAQYQKNFDERSYLRLFGYSEYSNWFINGPVSANLDYGGELQDYEVHGNTFGATAVYSNQLNDQNLLTATASYQTQKLETYSGDTFGTVDTNLVDSKGNCYNPTSGAYASCFTPLYNPDGSANASGGLNQYSQYGVPVVGFPGSTLTPAITAPAGSPAIANGAQWLVTENGREAQIDEITPFFTAASLTDQFRPNDKTTINLGLRAENFLYRLNDTVNDFPARAFWFQAYNRENCFPNGATSVEFAGVDPTTGESLCATGTNANLQNTSPHTVSSSVFEPRFGATYTVDPQTVLRASFGRYAAPVPTSYQQYDVVQQDLASFIGQFLPYGFNTPYHVSQPSFSNNYDFSIEHNFKNTDYAVKITPYYRDTQNQLANIPIGAQGVLDGLNVGNQKNYGLEFMFKKGDFGRDGLAFQLSYTYTHSRVTYTDFSNGVNVIDTLNNYIKNYNAYTSACAKSPTSSLCGSTSNGSPAAACYTPATAGGGGLPDPSCATGDIANPYYNMPVQPLFDRNGSYTPYDILPSPFQGANGYETPNVATIVVNYKKGPFSITPSATFSGGSFYGSPLTYPGYDPVTCGATTGGTTADTTTCGSYLFIPDKFSGKFDTFGAYSEPERLTVNLQLAYQTTKNTHLTLTMTGLMDTCYQRGYAWDNNSTCVYAQLPSNHLAPAGNFVSDPPVQLEFPYGSWYNNSQTGYVGQKLPFNAFVTFDVKI